MRIIKIELDSGEIETLITNEYKIPYSEFKPLYFMRWGVEKKYDIIKNKLEITNFSGRTETAIRQDFFIHMMYANIIAAAQQEAAEELKKEKAEKEALCRANGEQIKELKYDYKTNTNNAVGVFRDNLTKIILAKNDDERDKIWAIVMSDIKDAAIPIRPGRTVPRIENTRKAKHHHNHKCNL